MSRAREEREEMDIVNAADGTPAKIDRTGRLATDAAAWQAGLADGRFVAVETLADRLASARDRTIRAAVRLVLALDPAVLVVTILVARRGMRCPRHSQPMTHTERPELPGKEHHERNGHD